MSVGQLSFCPEVPAPLFCVCLSSRKIDFDISIGFLFPMIGFDEIDKFVNISSYKLVRFASCAQALC